MEPATEIRRGRGIALSTSNSKNIPIDKVRTDGGTQPRAGINAEHVDRMLAALDDGESMPSVVVYYDGNDYWLADGFHRLAALRQRQSYIDAEIHQGTRREAVLYSVGANRTHGLPRSREDTRRAIETLLRDEEWGKWSDREIARKVGCSPTTVGGIRTRLQESGVQVGHLTERKAPDGKSYSVAPKVAPASTPPAPPKCKDCGQEVIGMSHSGACQGCYYIGLAARPDVEGDKANYLAAAEQYTRDFSSEPLRSQRLAQVALMRRVAQAAHAAPAAPAFSLPSGGDERRFPSPPEGWEWVETDWGYQLRHKAKGFTTKNYGKAESAIDEAALFADRIAPAEPIACAPGWLDNLRPAPDAAPAAPAPQHPELPPLDIVAGLAEFGVEVKGSKWNDYFGHTVYQIAMNNGRELSKTIEGLEAMLQDMRAKAAPQAAPEPCPSAAPTLPAALVQRAAQLGYTLKLRSDGRVDFSKNNAPYGREESIAAAQSRIEQIETILVRRAAEAQQEAAPVVPPEDEPLDRDNALQGMSADMDVFLREIEIHELQTLFLLLVSEHGHGAFDTFNEEELHRQTLAACNAKLAQMSDRKLAWLVERFL